MTTKVTVECEYTNCPTSKMLVGVVSEEGHISARLHEPPFKLEFWIHDGNRVIAREASRKDVLDRV